MKNKFKRIQRTELFITPEPNWYNTYIEGNSYKITKNGKALSDFRWHILECKNTPEGRFYYLYPKCFGDAGRHDGWVWLFAKEMSIKELLDESVGHTNHVCQVKNKDMIVIYEQIHTTEVSDR